MNKLKTIALRGLLVLSIAGLFIWTPANAADAPEITVYKSLTCSCCEKWVQHLRDNGFTVKVHNVVNLAQIMRANSITPATASCHTALVDGYVVEGHVPAAVIKRLLTERPAVKGIAVPGMPAGSPGMEGPRSEHYNVLTFDADGKVLGVYTSR